MQVKEILKKYLINGTTDFNAILSIKSEERIVNLAKADREGLQKVFAAQIAFALEYFNLRYGLSPIQIGILSDEIIDDSESDNLSVQDVYIFLLYLATGKMGKIYDRLDIPTFMELFEIYREDRHQAFKSIEYEKEQQYKTYGDAERTTIDTEKELHRTAFSEHLKNQFKP
jgi:hypothetical protein